MGKFSGPSVIPGAQVELPTGTGQLGGDFADFQVAPEQAPPVEAAIPTEQPTEAAQRSPEVHQVAPEAVEGVDLQEAALVQEQRGRERVPAISEKLGGTFTEFATEADNPLGAALQRGQNVTNFIEYTPDANSLVAQPTAAKRELLAAGHTEAAFASDTGVKALKDSAASITPASVLFDPRILDAAVPRQDGTLAIDPEFGQVMSFATEAFLFQETQGNKTTPTETAEGVVDEGSVAEFTKAKGNQQLGREVYRQWMRQKAAREGRPTDEYVANEQQIEPATFTFLGDMAKEIYAQANPNMLRRMPADPEGQVNFQVTAEGIRKMDALENQYKGLLGSQEVAPLNAPSETAQPVYESATRVRKRTTVVGELGDTSQVDEAMANYHGVQYINDPGREKTAMALSIIGLLEHGQDSFYANLFDIGQAKVESVQGKKDQMTDEANRMPAGPEKNAAMHEANNYNVQDIVSRDRNKFLNGMAGMANYSGRANHLTFSMQGLTGRTHVQQTVYNPQANKTLRFVVGSGNVFSWKPGEGALDRDWREIVASHIVPNGKDLSTTERLKQFDMMLNNGQFDGLIDMGRQYNEWLNAIEVTPLKEAFQAIATAKNQQEINQTKQRIANMVPPKLPSAITEHFGTDVNDETLYELEVLGDLAKYADAKKNGRPMTSTINVEMDGKTHGPATNGAQLGVKGMAERTGLIRTQDYTVTDAIDSRKAMGEWMNESVEAFNGTLYPAEKADGYVNLLKAAVKDRANFLKKSPMTMGYGQELGSLRMHVDTTIFSGSQANTINSIMKDAGISPKEAGDFLHAMLVNSIYEVFDRKVVDSARLLRANNFMATITNETLWMENAMGFKSYAAAKQNQKGEEDSIDYYQIKEGKRSKLATAKIYKEKAEGSAVRKYDADSAPVPGGYGHGRVIPIAVQSYDGNMVSKTGSGQSWDRIKKTSSARGGKNAFVLPIFDAFKTDLGSFGAVREEANRNWVDGLRNHSYIQSIMKDWYQESKQNFRERVKSMPDMPVDMNMDNEWRGLYWAFNVEVEAGGGEPQLALTYMLKSIMATDPKAQELTVLEYQQALGRQAKKITGMIFEKMEQAGIPPTFDTLMPSQILQLVNIIDEVVGIGSRNQRMVSQIQRDKDELFRTVDRSGREARQVDIA